MVIFSASKSPLFWNYASLEHSTPQASPFHCQPAYHTPRPALVTMLTRNRCATCVLEQNGAKSRLQHVAKSTTRSNLPSPPRQPLVSETLAPPCKRTAPHSTTSPQNTCVPAGVPRPPRARPAHSTAVSQSSPPAAICSNPLPPPPPVGAVSPPRSIALAYFRNARRVRIAARCAILPPH